MVCTTAMRTFIVLRLLFGRFGFVLIPIALILIQTSIISAFVFTAFCLERLSDFKFLKIINSSLKIKLVQFDIGTKNDRLPFFRLCLVEDENQFVIRQFTRFRLTFFPWEVW